MTPAGSRELYPFVAYMERRLDVIVTMNPSASTGSVDVVLVRAPEGQAQ